MTTEIGDTVLITKALLRYGDPRVIRSGDGWVEVCGERYRVIGIEALTVTAVREA